MLYIEDIKDSQKGKSGKHKYTTVIESLSNANKETQDLFNTVKEYILALGDDVIFSEAKYYFIFRRIKNFACVEIRPTQNRIILYLKLNPETFVMEDGFSRDVTKIGHFGTGNLEITIADTTSFQKAKELINQSYEMC